MRAFDVIDFYAVTDKLRNFRFAFCVFRQIVLRFERVELAALGLEFDALRLAAVDV